MLLIYLDLVPLDLMYLLVDHLSHDPSSTLALCSYLFGLSFQSLSMITNVRIIKCCML